MLEAQRENKLKGPSSKLKGFFIFLSALSFQQLRLWAALR